MNQYLLANGGRRLGDLNPLLYRIAAGRALPAFRDVTLGGNAVDDAAPGYDLVTGLGTPGRRQPGPQHPRTCRGTAMTHRRTTDPPPSAGSADARFPPASSAVCADAI